jgi:tetratricopeptide (TPR) repeat protein
VDIKKCFLNFLIIIFFVILNIQISFSESNKKELKIYTYFWSAQYFTQEENFEKAIELYKKIIELKPDFVDAHYYLAKIYKRLNRLKEALDELKIVKELKTDDSLVAEVQNIDIDVEIKELEKEIKEKTIQEEPEYKEKKEGIFDVLISKVNNKLVIYKGRIDGFIERQELYLFKGKKKVAKIKLKKVLRFSSKAIVLEDYGLPKISANDKINFKIMFITSQEE